MSFIYHVNVIQNSVCLKNLTEAIEGKASPHYEMNMEHGQNERLDSDSGIAGTLKPEYWEGKEDEDEWCSEIFTIIYLHLPTFTNHDTWIETWRWRILQHLHQSYLDHHDSQNLSETESPRRLNKKVAPLIRYKQLPHTN